MVAVTDAVLVILEEVSVNQAGVLDGTGVYYIKHQYHLNIE